MILIIVQVFLCSSRQPYNAREFSNLSLGTDALTCSGPCAATHRLHTSGAGSAMFDCQDRVALPEIHHLKVCLESTENSVYAAKLYSVWTDSNVDRVIALELRSMGQLLPTQLESEMFLEQIPKRLFTL
ncbi:hypothetical protein AVEN_255214-1 [Araneus ventricosus]|uniref:Uncharacterized protein n=1 Tax=Araneus ventricosus TaxID=182803 RepID=A0A4Y2BCQ9_ARAVE|nr:hypothetical protein AVEN_255214-1 [Araneus ventricosus]